MQWPFSCIALFIFKGDIGDVDNVIAGQLDAKP